ncbi:hypothetical protein CHU98_g3404 [Xylaria longipes]|nr:hypothetical protein CHU98_g3404 [Xylaria longipes]
MEKVEADYARHVDGIRPSSQYLVHTNRSHSLCSHPSSTFIQDNHFINWYQNFPSRLQVDQSNVPAHEMSIPILRQAPIAMLEPITSRYYTSRMAESRNTTRDYRASSQSSYLLLYRATSSLPSDGYTAIPILRTAKGIDLGATRYANIAA